MFIILDELQNHLQVKKPVGLNWLYVTFRNYVVVNLSFVQYSVPLPPKIQSSSFSVVLHTLETDLCELHPTLRFISNVFRWWKIEEQGISLDSLSNTCGHMSKGKKPVLLLTVRSKQN